MDKFAPNAHPSCWGSCGSAWKADPGGGGSGRGPEPPEGGRDVQHRGRELEEEEFAAGGSDGCFHHCERYRHNQVWAMSAAALSHVRCDTEPVGR